jgi:hypothetical protein
MRLIVKVKLKVLCSKLLDNVKIMLLVIILVILSLHCFNELLLIIKLFNILFFLFF